MKTTRYFDEQVRVKRPYIQIAWIKATLTKPERRLVQPDGRVRLWIGIDHDGMRRFLRIVLLDDGETVHDAFFDRGYRE